MQSKLGLVVIGILGSLLFVWMTLVFGLHVKGLTVEALDVEALQFVETAIPLVTNECNEQQLKKTLSDYFMRITPLETYRNGSCLKFRGDLGTFERIRETQGHRKTTFWLDRLAWEERATIQVMAKYANARNARFTLYLKKYPQGWQLDGISRRD